MEKKEITKFELTGIAGEYFVAAELSRLNLIATLTLKNTRGTDILASNIQSTKTVAIQVKTSHVNDKSWVLKESDENFKSANHFYVFVALKSPGIYPDYHIIPSETVATQIKTGHQNWLNTPGKKGQQRKDSTLRKFKVDSEDYLNNWKVLGLF